MQFYSGSPMHFLSGVDKTGMGGGIIAEIST